MSENFYGALGVPRDATVDDIKKAYKKAALKHHPDKGGDEELFKAVNQAFETLSDDVKRAAYDRNLLRTRSKDGLSGGAGLVREERSNSRGPPGQDARRASAASSQPGRRPSNNQGGDAGNSRPPRPQGAVEIPPDPSALSAKELKELLSNLGVRHDDCFEKGDLLERLKNRRNFAGDSTPRGYGGRPSTGSQPQASSQQPAPEPARTAAPSPTTAGAGPGSGGGAATARAIRIKVVSMGSSGVGKSCLIKRFCEGRFVSRYISTIGVDYGVKQVATSHAGQQAKVNFFDLSGVDEFSEIRQEFYADANGVLLIYDVGQLDSFRKLPQWIEEAKQNGLSMQVPTSSAAGMPQGPFVVVCANKSDLAAQRQVSRADGATFAAQRGYHYFETSAQSGENVNEALNLLFDKIVGHLLSQKKQFGL